ncbi:MAG: glutathione S-transferase family protein [Proteobacteria bacterium]|nr:glutathione S-transferase family protein [Pseudomonadota bacterium]
MNLQIYGHPFSSYCQKVLIALYENATPFQFRHIRWDDALCVAEFERLWPLKRMPVLVAGAAGVVLRRCRRSRR